MSSIVELLNKLVDLFWEIKKQFAAMFMRKSAENVDKVVEQAKTASTPEERENALDEIIKVERDL